MRPYIYRGYYAQARPYPASREPAKSRRRNAATRFKKRARSRLADELRRLRREAGEEGSDV